MEKETEDKIRGQIASHESELSKLISDHDKMVETFQKHDAIFRKQSNDNQRNANILEGKIEALKTLLPLEG